MESRTDSPLSVYRRQTGIKQRVLARKFGVNAPALSKWERKRVPAERVLDIERLTGIPRHVLRPDIYPAPKFRASRTVAA